MSTQFEPFSTKQVSVGNTATLISAANPSRQSLTITNLGTVDVYWGDVNVSTSNGDIIVGTKGAAKSIPTTSAVYAVVSAGSQSVSVVEITK